MISTELLIDGWGRTDGETCPIPKRRFDERSARERLFYRVLATYPQPHTIEGRSELTVVDVMAGRIA